MNQYTRNPPLLETDVAADPLVQLEAWLDDAKGAGMIEPTAMTLATIEADGRPSARVVLFKGFLDGGLQFYTNYDSAKAQAIARQPAVALTFWWDRLERSVRVEGIAARVDRAQSERYFALRPRASQLGAAVSRQSQVVDSRAELESRLSALEQALGDAPVPCPPNWGGYRVEPHRFEFWQGRGGRLHDRLEYRRDGNAWPIRRLEP